VQFGRELIVRLERIKLEAATALAARTDSALPGGHLNPAVALVATLEGDRPVLPWEADPALKDARSFLGESGFARRIAQGEREELAARDFGKACELYRQAEAGAQHPVQASYARLLLARSLAASGRDAEARAGYQALLAHHSEIIDDQGIPIWLYAATRLVQAGTDGDIALSRLHRHMDERSHPGPAEAYMLRRLAKELAVSASDPADRASAQDLQQRLDERIRFLEQALALQNDYPRLPLNQPTSIQSNPAEPVWLPYGEDLWLISVAPPLSRLAPVLVAVRVRALAGEEFFTGAGSEGEPLGAAFPGLRVSFRPPAGTPAGRWRLQDIFYSLTILLVVAVASLGAGLLWRDMRREMRLAEMRSQFVSSVSHELKTPLTAIRMFAETLQMGRAADPETMAECTDTIVHESERLTRLLNNVLDFSKIERGERSYRLQPVCLADAVRAAAGTLKYPLAEQGFRLQVEIEDGLPDVSVDADAMQQAVLNLLGNAMKYSGANREISLRMRREDGRAVIEVADGGVGIRPEEQARIFEKFYRTPAPGNRLIPGTGLGLTLVEHIAKGHGGHVTVRSAPGQGSTFAIHIPLEQGT
jgi:signal transduction histidine kinase